MVLKRFNLYYNITHESYLSGLLQIISAPETGNPCTTSSPALYISGVGGEGPYYSILIYILLGVTFYC